MNEWLAGQTEEPTFIEDNYADPSRVKLTFPDRKRNLIYIYLESMETTYADPESVEAFPSNVITELTALDGTGYKEIAEPDLGNLIEAFEAKESDK